MQTCITCPNGTGKFNAPEENVPLTRSGTSDILVLYGFTKLLAAHSQRNVFQSVLLIATQLTFAYSEGAKFLYFISVQWASNSAWEANSSPTLQTDFSSSAIFQQFNWIELATAFPRRHPVGPCESVYWRFPCIGRSMVVRKVVFNFQGFGYVFEHLLGHTILSELNPMRQSSIQKFTGVVIPPCHSCLTQRKKFI